jgi:HlyD family secretion protein
VQGPEQLLRKASLERLSSPEQLDMIMRVTSPLGWVALVAIGVLIVAGIF